MREKNRQAWHRFKAIFIIALLAGAVYVFMNRVAIKDHLSTYFM